jgi:hypothetical protein
MTSAMAAFGIAVGGASLICYALMTRLQHRRADRRWSGDSSGFDGGNYSGGDGWSLLNWIGGDHSASDSSAIRAPEVGRRWRWRKRLTLLPTMAHASPKSPHQSCVL